MLPAYVFLQYVVWLIRTPVCCLLFTVPYPSFIGIAH